MDFKQRVIDEKNELDGKTRRLTDFIEVNGFFKNLDAPEQSRLIRQRDIMREYSAVLGERITAWAESANAKVSDGLNT